MPNTPLPEFFQSVVTSLRRSGATFSQISIYLHDLHGVTRSPAAVRSICLKHRVEKPPKVVTPKVRTPRASILAPHLDEVRRLRFDGHTFREISDRLGGQGIQITHAAVANFCQAHDLHPEPLEEVRKRLDNNRKNIAESLFRGLGLDRIASLYLAPPRVLRQYIRETKLTQEERRRRNREGCRILHKQLAVSHESVMNMRAQGHSVRKIALLCIGNAGGAARQAVADYLAANKI